MVHPLEELLRSHGVPGTVTLVVVIVLLVGLRLLRMGLIRRRRSDRRTGGHGPRSGESHGGRRRR